MSIELFEDAVWQMSLGERAAVEGLLSQLRPALAIEIGSAEGACLRRIAAHSMEVHSFDLDAPRLGHGPNVTLHTGDSHALLPAFLAGLAEQGRNVDFVMVDGDHSPDGVRRDLEDLLDSDAIRDTAIVIHDTANERVRQGVDAVRFAAWPKVSSVDLDWVPGRMFASPELRHELWYGLGLVRVDARAHTYGTQVYEQRYRPSAPLLSAAKELILAAEALDHEAAAGGASRDPVGVLRARLSALQEELASVRARETSLRESTVQISRDLDDARDERSRREGLERTLAEVMSSPSWRLTKPLRDAKQRLGGS